MVKLLPRPSAVVVLIGAPGSGKTRTGKRVAKALGLEFIDTDQVVVAAHGPITEIFEHDGEAAFRSYEREAVARALRQHAVVALGGGAVLDRATQRDLRHLPVAQLTVSRDGILARLGEEPDALEQRPLLRDGGIEAWERLVAERQPLYDRLTTKAFDTSSRPFERVADDIVAWLRERDEQATTAAIIAATSIGTMG